MARLKVLRFEAHDKIAERIAKGEALLKLKISNERELDELISSRKIWSDYNSDMLKTIFDSDIISIQYGGVNPIIFNGGLGLESEISLVHAVVNDSLTKLRSIDGRLELFQEQLGYTTSMLPSESTNRNGKKVFVVHGHDEALKVSVARLLEKLNLEPIILHEQVDGGVTTIEKFEKTLM